MDERMAFMNEVLSIMAHYLTPDMLEILKATLLRQLQYVQVTSNTQLMRIPQNYDYNDRMFKLFVASRRLEGMSERTISMYTYITKKFLNRVNKMLNEVTAIDVQFYLSEYEQIHKVSRRTLESMRLSINGVYVWLYKNEYIDKNPLMQTSPIAYEQKDVVILDEAEIFKIREAARENLRTRAIVELLLATGVRVSELCAINIDDIDFEKGEIIIHCAKKRRKQNRLLYLTAEAEECLKAYLEYRTTLVSPDGNALFIANRNKGMRVTERIVNGSLRKIEKRAGITKHLTVHIFRKTLSSILWKRGCSPLVIAKILGHSDTRMSEKYYIGVQSEEVKNSYYKYR